MDKNNNFYVQEAIKQMKESIANNENGLVPHSITNQIDVDNTEHFFEFEKVFSISAPDDTEKLIHIIVNISYEQNICDVTIKDENNELASLKIEDNFEELNDLRNILLEKMCVEKNANIYGFPSWVMTCINEVIAAPEEQKSFEDIFHRLDTYEEFKEWIDTNSWIKKKMFKIRDYSIPSIWTEITASLYGILEYEINREELVIEEIQDKLKEKRTLYSKVIQLLKAEDLTPLGYSYVESDVLHTKYINRFDKNCSIARWKDNNFNL